jgi:hypothetical protein
MRSVPGGFENFPMRALSGLRLMPVAAPVWDSQNYICKFNSLWRRFNRPTVADLGAERHFCRELSRRPLFRAEGAISGVAAGDNVGMASR